MTNTDCIFCKGDRPVLAETTVKDQLQKEFEPQGFNIGVNCEEAGGQTIFHAHIHIIPRYTGDAANPRGGVRNIIPGKGNY